jgi:small GTP-binding protein
VAICNTPGHPDFIAEVERVLSVFDVAVLVISAVEGVQAQTRVLMRTLQRLHIPTLIFVNKIDREGALEYVFDRYQPARGTIPTRSRTDHNPLNRRRHCGRGRRPRGDIERGPA